MKNATLLESRLGLLPRKVAVPFRRLMETNQLCDEVLNTILDAGELSGDQHKLLGFAVGYLHLRSKGVPINDVIRMARDQGRRIRLSWSEQRWRDEHDRLSRAAALKKLAEESVQYDLEKYEAVLPNAFPGYLIRTSRRLGMEGLRQRHCVASYHQQLVNGYCALAVVFLDRKRWTVQLALTGKQETPLRIQQIRTKLNGKPTAHEKSAIYEMFDVDLISASSHGLRQVRPAQQPSYMDNLRLLLPVLREHESGNVTVTFDGSGDSGSVDHACYENSTFNGDTVHVTCIRTTSRFEDRQWVTTQEEVETTVNDAIDVLVNDYLDDTGVNWYDNDGGYGELTINVDEGIVTMDVNVRWTESQNEYYGEHDIDTGEHLTSSPP